MESSFVKRLTLANDLDYVDQSKLEALCSRTKHVPAKRYILRSGDSQTVTPIILSGWVARFQILRNGSRQITSILLPGDIGHLGPANIGETDEFVTLCPAKIAYADRSDIEEMMECRPAIAEALRHAEQSQLAQLSSWIVNVGRRNALERMAHFICETWYRMAIIGEVSEDSFYFPLTQDDLADVLSLTPVHTNRKLQQLRQEKLISLQSKELTILDRRGLVGAADFHSNYLAHSTARTSSPSRMLAESNPLYC